VNIRNMWRLSQLGRRKWHGPWVHAKALADNNIRIWVFSLRTLTASDPVAMIGYADQAEGTNRDFSPTTARSAGSRSWPVYTRSL
jgi:hypothetical protein